MYAMDNERVVKSLCCLHLEWGHSSDTSSKSWKHRDGFTVGESRGQFRYAKQGR